MKLKVCFILVSLALIHCLKGPADAIKIIFLTKDLKFLGGTEEEDKTKNGKTAVIQKLGELIASWESDEGNIVISASSVTLYLQNLNLSSKKNSKLIQEMMFFVLNMI